MSLYSSAVTADMDLGLPGSCVEELDVMPMMACTCKLLPNLISTQYLRM